MTASGRPRVEFGMTCRAVPGRMGELARRVENAGYDILLLSDTQNLAPEIYGPLTEAALATTSLRVGSGVTNPVTRHASVTASAMGNLQVLSRGRAICGLGRGDSAVALAGLPPASLSETRRYVEALKRYWGGHSDDPLRDELQWYRPTGTPAPPIDLACSGERMIKQAADLADRVSFTVGAVPERVEWALNVLSERLHEIGRPRESIQAGAYVNASLNSDLTQAIAAVRASVGVLAHFPADAGGQAQALSEGRRSEINTLRASYDSTEHGSFEARHLQTVSDDFVEWFAIVGDVGTCRSRVTDLLECGLQHLYIVGPTYPSRDQSRRVVELVDSNHEFSTEVLANVRAREGAER